MPCTSCQGTRYRQFSFLTLDMQLRTARTSIPTRILTSISRQIFHLCRKWFPNTDKRKAARPVGTNPKDRQGQEHHLAGMPSTHVAKEGHNMASRSDKETYLAMPKSVASIRQELPQNHPDHTGNGDRTLAAPSVSCDSVNYLSPTPSSSVTTSFMGMSCASTGRESNSWNE